jgi:ATP-dependent RNA helicase DDX51/DBP6
MRLCELFFGEGVRGEDEPNTAEEAEGKALVVKAYSSDLPVSERKTVLDMFKNRKVHMYVLRSPNSCCPFANSSCDVLHRHHQSLLHATLSSSTQSLISSDLISRGIDITHVRHVVSYDAPVDMRKYVHRVGRTARAGREGHAWCLVEEHEVGASSVWWGMDH